MLDDEHDVKWGEARMERAAQIAAFEAEEWVFRLTPGVLKCSYYKKKSASILAICIIGKNITVHAIRM